MSWIQLQPCSSGQTLPLRKSSRNSIIEPYYLEPFRSPLMSQHTMLYCMYRTTLFCRGHIQFGPVVHLPSNQFLIQWGTTRNSYDANPNAVGCKQLNSSWFDFACHFIFKPKFTRPFLSDIISIHVAFIKFLLCILLLILWSIEHFLNSIRNTLYSIHLAFRQDNKHINCRSRWELIHRGYGGERRNHDRGGWSTCCFTETKKKLYWSRDTITITRSSFNAVYDRGINTFTRNTQSKQT